jgi:DNA polymerase-3 subunit alpha
LGAVRGVGSGALETIFEARKAGGPFRDLFEFAVRVDARKINKGVLESLVQCGAFDSGLAELGISRARAYAAVDAALERSRSASRDRERGQTTLFGLFDAAPSPAASANAAPARPTVDYPEVEEWDQNHLLAMEKQALGCYVSGHPLNRYAGKLNRLGVTASSALGDAAAWTVVSVVGMVEGYQEKFFRNGSGGKASFFEIEDLSGRVRAKLRGDRVDLLAPLITGGQPVIVTGKVSFPMSDDAASDTDPTLLVDEVELLSQAVRRGARAVCIRLKASQTAATQLRSLKELLHSRPGSCPVEIVFSLEDGAQTVLSLDGTKVEPDDAMLTRLERLFGDNVAELL